ncbi:MAG: hypothetical protein AB1742_16345 [bacterium]
MSRETGARRRKAVFEADSIRVAADAGAEGLFVFQVRRRGWHDVVMFDAGARGGERGAPGAVLEAGSSCGAIPLKLEKVHREGKDARIVFTGNRRGIAVTQELMLRRGWKWIEVNSSCSFEKDALLRSFFSNFLFVPGGGVYSDYAPLKYCWIPNIRKTRRHVSPDQVFRSPAVILCTEKFSVSLVPDLDHLGRRRPMETCLDLRLAGLGGDDEAPALGFGFRRYRPDGHTYFAPTGQGARVGAGEERRLRFFLYAAASGPEDALRETLGFTWRRWGRAHMGGVEPQTVPFERCAEYGADFAVRRGRIWRDFEFDGTPCGGTLAFHFPGKRYPKTMDAAQTRRFFRLSGARDRVFRFSVERLMPLPAMNDVLEEFIYNTRMSVPPVILFQAWFNNLRTACGLYRFGRRWGDARLVERARLIRSLALAAPAWKGLFATVCCAARDGVFWYEGTRGFRPTTEYHLPDNAWTGCWMLRWHRELERDARLVRRCADLGDALLGMQKDDGSIPSWVRVRGGKLTPSPLLERSAQTAAPAMFLARLSSVTGVKKYLQAAVRAGDFLRREVIPGDRWFDFETFFSCSKKSLDMTDAYFPIPPQNNLCLFWAAELFRELYGATGDAGCLRTGRNLLDRLCLYQQVWNAPHLDINTFGGFGVMNTDAEWNDARQSMFAETLMDYYAATGVREYFERGIAALRASFTLMLIPENRGAAPGNLTTFLAKDAGATFENYAHHGFDRRVVGYIMHDWGTGGAMTSAARTLDRFGDFLINVRRKHAFGINFCTLGGLRVANGTIGFEIESPSLHGREWRGKLIGVPPGKWDVVVNGRRAARFDARTGSRWLRFRIGGEGAPGPALRAPAARMT